MKNRVGDNNPSPEAIAAHKRIIEGLLAELAQTTVHLSPEERQRVTKFRSGGEQIVRLIAGIAKDYGVVLPGFPAASLEGDLELAERLRPLLFAAERLQQVLADTILQAHSECWWGTTAYYTTLVRMSGTDAELVRLLKPAIEFFATGKRKPAEPK